MKVTVNQLTPLTVTVEFERTNAGQSVRSYTYDEDEPVSYISATGDLGIPEIIEDAILIGLTDLRERLDRGELHR